MRKIQLQKQGDFLLIGDMPQLVVDLKNQNNYVKVLDMKIPYQRRVEFSADLLEGKRSEVLNTAVNYHYQRACELIEGVKAAQDYRQKANTTVREVNRDSTTH